MTKIETDLQSWALTLPVWQQSAFAKLSTGQSVADSDIDSYVELIKAGGKAPSATTRPSASSQSASKGSVRLISLCELEGIENLRPRKPLKFSNSAITVIYGANGAGKSGYVRLIKALSGKLTIDSLHTSVFDKSPTKRKCKLHYSIDGKTHEVSIDLLQEIPLAILSDLSIFDSENGRIYLTKDKTATFVPRPLAVFEELVRVCIRVKEKLALERQAFPSCLPALPLQYRSTSMGLLYENLSGRSKSEIQRKLVWSDEDSQRLKQIEQILLMQDPMDLIKNLNRQCQQIDALRAVVLDLLQKYSEPNYRALSLARESAKVARAAVQEGAKVLAGYSKLDGLSSTVWRSLWEAARRYSVEQAYPQHQFPFISADALCPFCQQPLQATAQERLSAFQGFVEGQLERDASQAESKLATMIAELSEIPAIEQVVLQAEGAALSEPRIVEVKMLLASLQMARVAFLESSEQQAFPDGAPLVASLVSARTDLESRISKIESDLEPAARQSLQNERLELEGLKWAVEQKQAILDEVDRLGVLARYEGWFKDCDHTGISRKAGKVSGELLSDAYISRFKEELSFLRANHIGVELVRSKMSDGKPLHAVRLSGLDDKESAKKTSILSDGEKNIVGLAAFLADMSGCVDSIPFIFDDPITSLDQEFEERVVDRLVELGKSRQVVVFTHRLSFLSLLLSSPEVSDGDLVCIRRESWGAGEPINTPLFAKNPKGALNDLKNERLARAAKVLNDGGSEEYYPLARTITSDFRILLERCVEVYLLADVVARHRRDVNTKGKLSKLALVTKSDCDEIETLMGKYSIQEHSQSLELPSQLPTPQELESDIDRALALVESIDKRFKGKS